MDLGFVTAPSGARFTVNKLYADKFSGLLTDLEAAGYGIKGDQSGGYNPRMIAGTNTPSRHASGAAIDVNWTDNPRGAAGAIPSELARSLAAKHGLTWGGDWKNPDPMHFEIPGQPGHTFGDGHNHGTPAAAGGAAVTTPAGAPMAPTYSNPGMSEADIASSRKMAQALMMQGTDASPVGHWTQALARALQGAVGGMYQSQAVKGEKDRSSALAAALAGSGAMSGLNDGDRAVLSQNPAIMSAVAAKTMANKLDPNAGLNRQLLEAKIKQMQSGGEQPSNVREWQYFKSLTPEQQQQYLVMKRAEKVIDTGTGFYRTNPTDPSNPTPVIKKDIIGKERAEAIGKAQGAATMDLPRVLGNAQQTLDLIDKIKRNPGTERNFGVQGYIPNMPGGKAADAWSMIEQLGGKAFLEAFNSLKGGGQITEVEGQKATNAIARLQKAQSYQSFIEALSDFEDVVKSGVARAKGAAGQGGGGPSADGGWSVREVK